LKTRDFSSFFEEYKEAIADLDIPKKDFERIFHLFVESDTSSKTVDDLGEDIDKINLKKPFETILLVCISSIENLFTTNLNSEIDNKSEDIMLSFSDREIHVLLFKLFFILKSPINENRQVAFIIFSVFLTILGFSNICDKSELIKFASNIFKKNDFDLQEILLGMFRSLHFLANKDANTIYKPQNTNVYH